MIDWQRVQDLKREIGADAFGEVVPLFLAELEEVLSALQSATTAHDLKSALHALKGNALNLGFTDLAQLCQTLESRAEQDETDLPLPEVYTVLDRSRAAFLAELDTLGSAPRS